jgi:N-acyl-L-homoserine lactone synthetase
MIHIVNAENRHLFRHALMEMHRQRKAVFIDDLKWRLDETAGIEIDSYDSADAIYLIEADSPRESVIGSARLLPTDRPHLLGEVFPHLCASPPPSGAHVWEATRFCPAPGTPCGGPRRQMLARMIAAIMETALLFGIERVTFVANAALAPLALNAGWSAAPLGPSQRSGRDRLTAIAAEIDTVGLRLVRTRNGIGGPLTRFMPGDVAAAA